MDNTPYWFILLAIVDSILLIAIVLLILKRIPAGKKLGKPNLNILFQYNIPLRALVGLLQNDVANSRYQAKLDEQSR